MLPAGIQPISDGDPRRIGQFQVIGRLGAGGMGIVYAARSSAGDRIAIKQIRPEYAADPEFRSRFAREVALTARVAGPCLVPLLDADTQAERPWLATPYVPGPTLDQYLAQHGPLEGTALIALAAGTAAALAAIHAAGVVHRDLKPSNVILSPGGPCVLDFGIAHAVESTSITRTGAWTGTPGWTSPEQYQGTAGDAQSDVFTWGALAAYAATGRQPFGGGRPDAIAYRILSGDPDLAGVPEALLPHVAAALAKDPRDRPPAHGVAEHLGRQLAEQNTVVAQSALSTLVLPTSGFDAAVAEAWQLPTAFVDAPWPAAQGPGRRRLIGAISAIAAVAVLAGVAVVMWPAGDSPATARHKTSGSLVGGQMAAAGATPSTAPPSAPVTSLSDGIGARMLVAPPSFDGAPLTTANSLGNTLGAANQKITATGQTPVTAIYGPDTGMPKYVSYGLYGSLALPSLQLDTAFTFVGSGSTIAQTTDENAGALGGVIRCGVMTPASNTAVQIPICAWADHSTMDILMQMPDSNGASATVDLTALAEKTRELRQQMEVAR